ncbi:MAG: MFS transporter [Catalinimonas sp.]
MLTGSLAPGLVALVVSGVGRVLIFTTLNTLLQTPADDDKRGRALSLYVTSFVGALTVDSLLMGFFADQMGAPPTVLIGCVGAALPFGRRRRAFA